MSWRILISAVLLLASVHACLPPPLDERGKLCSEARPCGPGYVCRQERCIPEGETDGGHTDGGSDGGHTDGGSDGGHTDGGSDGGPDCEVVVGNLLTNGDFEQPAVPPGSPATAPEGWSVSGAAEVAVVLQGARCGRQAATVTAMSAGAMGLAPTTAPVLGTGSSLYCASAWLRSSADAGHSMRLEIREFDNNGQLRDTGASPSVTPRDTWLQVFASYRATDRESLNVRAYAPSAPAGAVMQVDGVALWRSTGGGCPQ